METLLSGGDDSERFLSTIEGLQNVRGESENWKEFCTLLNLVTVNPILRLISAILV